MTNNESLTAPLVLVFDTETTGTDPRIDQIIEISVQEGLEEGSSIKTRRIKPSVPISPGATAVHGITAEDLKDCPTFLQLGKGIREIFEKVEVLIGYNVMFDIEMLQAELSRNKFLPLDLSKKKIVDPFRIWRHYERRDLSSAYRNFVGGEFDDAHSAAADVTATVAVFKGMKKAFNIEDASYDELSKFTFDSKWVGFSNHIQWENEIPVFRFGKLSGKPVWDAAQADPSYIKWILSANFSPHMGEICKMAGALTKEKFLEAIYQQYGKPGTE